jgi:hypothetical protein
MLLLSLELLPADFFFLLAALLDDGCDDLSVIREDAVMARFLLTAFGYELDPEPGAASLGALPDDIPGRAVAAIASEGQAQRSPLQKFVSSSKVLESSTS